MRSLQLNCAVVSAELYGYTNYRLPYFIETNSLNYNKKIIILIFKTQVNEIRENLSHNYTNT